MKRLWKDVLAAMMFGLLLPGVLLNLAAAREDAAEPQAQTPPLETYPLGESVKMTLRQSDGQLRERDMDKYLVGVVLAEMPASFDEEALKAQSVVARTYARKAYETGGKHGDGSVCTESACCQGYLSEEAYLEKGGDHDSLDKVYRAVMATSGYVLTYEGSLIEATYFSCSGGSTEEAAAVWGQEYPYLQAVPSPGEESAAHFTDTVTFTPEEFQQAMGVELEGSPKTWFSDVEYTPGGGIAVMRVGEERYAGTYLRARLGLKSTAFSVSAEEDGVTITTKGYGHRVGMSQYGADAMAVTGSTYDRILAHYYPGTVLKQITETGSALSE